jgi:hypothetical protein
MQLRMQAANWASQLGEPFVAILHWLYWARQLAVHAPPCADADTGHSSASPESVTVVMARTFCQRRTLRLSSFRPCVFNGRRMNRR